MAVEWTKENMSDIVNTMLFYCNEAENGLNTFRDRIELYIRSCEEKIVPFSSETVINIYGKRI